MTTTHDIEVRRLELAFSDAAGPRYAGGDPLLSALLASLSVAFPPGERFFIASVRHYLPRIEDKALRKAIYAFIGQEANHTKEHQAFNEFLERVGYPALRMQRWVTERLERIERASAPAQNLARTAALEHFTAILASAILEHRALLESMAPAAAKLWAWHAIEEIEHRSVAFDVYREAVDDEALRVRTMVQVTALFCTLVSLRTVLMLRASGDLRDVRGIARGLNLLWGRPGIFRRIIPRYFDYYRPDFHPSQHDYGDCVAWAKARFLSDASSA
jgi:hypothetical protein